MPIAMIPLKYPSTPHWPWSEKVHRGDTYHQSPEFFLHKQVVITEKLDGGNTCLCEGKLYHRSVAAPAVHGSADMTKACHLWKLSAQGRALDGLAFYGEDLYGVHTLKYDPMLPEHTFNLFAVRELWHDCFFSWDEVESYALSLAMRTVPVVFRGVFHNTKEITEFFREQRKQPSSIGGEREGFVMRLEERFRDREFRKAVCKYVRKDHVQVNEEHWRKNWKPCKLIRHHPAP